MALICVSQQSRPPAATTASSAEPTAATEGVHHRHRHRHHHHHRHKDAGCRRRRHSSRRRCKDDDSSPSSRNRIRPLEPSADGEGGNCSGGGERSPLADKTADRKAAGAESEEEEGLDVMAAEQLVEDCDSGCECGPEEAEGERTQLYFISI